MADFIFYFNQVKIILLYGWPFILLFWILILKIKWKNWPLEAVIIEKRGKNLTKTNDRMGKYTDKYTGITGYRLQKSTDNVPVVNFEWMLHNVPVHTTIFDRFINLIRGNAGTIFFYKYGTKQLKPIYITENNQRKLIYKEIKDKSGNPIIIQIYEQFDPRQQLGGLNFQVIDWDNMNFMVQEQRASFERRQKEKSFWKEVLIPLTIIAVSALVAIIMIKFSADYASEMRATGGTPTQTPKEPATQPNVPVIGDLIPAS